MIARGCYRAALLRLRHPLPPPLLASSAARIFRLPLDSRAKNTLSLRLRTGGVGAGHVRELCSGSGSGGVVRASGQVSDSGSIDSPMMQSMEKKIKEQLNAETVTVRDAYGDGRHVSIDVVSAAFEGQSAVNRQRMVYKAIWEELQSTVHAVDQMTTRTPEEAARNK